MRIAKFISNAGVCSRRDAEKLILKGKVKINSVICNSLSTKVDLNDKIFVNNKNIKLDNTVRLWKMYKPIKYICSNKDPEKRATVFSLIPKNFPRLISIGRLDYMSEGLLLFTNNGDFARKIELPSSKILRIYKVCLKGKIDKKMINRINNGIKIDEINYNQVQIKIDKYNLDSTWIIFELLEGKNREIRNICKYFKLSIMKLIRVQYGSIKLLNEKEGEIKEIKKFSLKL